MSVYKGSFFIFVSVYTGCPCGGTRNIYIYIYIYTLLHVHSRAPGAGPKQEGASRQATPVWESPENGPRKPINLTSPNLGDHMNPERVYGLYALLGVMVL